MDGISSKLLKFAAPTIASSATKVINLSIQASKFLTLWKLNRVCIIYKKANYRPICIVWVLLKILVWHVLTHLSNFLNVLAAFDTISAYEIPILWNSTN